MAESLPSGSHTRLQHPLAPHKKEWWSLHICHCMGDFSMKLSNLPKGIHSLVDDVV